MRRASNVTAPKRIFLFNVCEKRKIVVNNERVAEANI